MPENIPYSFKTEGKQPEDVDDLVFCEETEPLTVSNR